MELIGTFLVYIKDAYLRFMILLKFIIDFIEDASLRLSWLLSDQAITLRRARPLDIQSIRDLLLSLLIVNVLILQSIILGWFSAAMPLLILM